MVKSGGTEVRWKDIFKTTAGQPREANWSINLETNISGVCRKRRDLKNIKFPIFSFRKAQKYDFIISR